MRRILPVLVIVLSSAVTACHPEFDLHKLSNNQALFDASMRQYHKGKWDNATAGFEKLTTVLSQRDTLLPLAFWYLGMSNARGGHELAAADAFNHIVSSFQDDSIAPYAAMESARAYRALWRRPSLDPSYGETAIEGYQQVMTFYPNSKLVPQARTELRDVQNWFAIKDYDNAHYYYRFDLIESAIIYLKQVMDRYPDAPKSKDAGLLLVDSYRKLKYDDDADDACALLKKRYPDDGAVKAKCPVRVVAPTATVKPPAGR